MNIIIKYKRCVLALAIWVVYSSLVWGAITAQERSALIAFYNATNGIAWGENWKNPPLDSDGFSTSGTEGSWYGITVEGDHVIKIILDNKNISGIIPPEIGNFGYLKTLKLLNNALTGNIPAEIGNLANLEELTLGSTFLSGNIPPEIGNLSNLMVLRLSGNRLTGSIPASLGNLRNLGFFELVANQLSGSIPSSLGNLYYLGVLDFQLNQLSGSIPPELGKLVNLQYFILNNNQLSGNLPSSLGNLNNVRYVYLINNQFSGDIPSSFGNLANVIDLWLNGNQLSGNIPPELGNLHTVKKLYLHHNKLSGEIPAALINLTAISDLDIGYNCLYTMDPTLRVWLNIHDADWESHQDQCDGVPPTIILTSPNGGETCSVGSSKVITWSTINMTGDVKIEYTFDNGSSWVEIIAATPNTGSYTWIVPDTVSSQCRVKISKASTGTPWDTSNNTFSIIPGSAASLTVLSPNGGETFVVGYPYPITWISTGIIENVKIDYTGDNGSTWTTINSSAPNTGSYTWTVPDIEASQYKIRISEAVGGIPADISDVAFSIVKTTIPGQERTALIAFYNSTNGDGWINKSGWKTPPLYLDGFAMPGTEGRWHGITIAENHVTKIAIYENNLTGSIPPETGTLCELQSLYLDSNKLSGSIPTDLGNLSKLQYLMLSQNVLSGTIPNSLTNLTNLIFLELANNRLSGVIPPEIGNLTGLKVLELGGNQLSGSIPASIGKLINLGRLYLNANRLSGSIPPELGGLISVDDLFLSGNPFTGSLPPELGNLRNLNTLYITSTQISGSIPHELGNLVNLQYFALYNNQLCGEIPSELGNLHNLECLYLMNNKLSGIIPAELGNITNLRKLHLENNLLSGEIPSYITNLIKIIELDLGYNCLKATDNTLRTWLDIHDPDWETHQDQCGAQNATITVLAPKGGEEWATGSSQYISWAYTGTIENVKIEYTTDNGSIWTTITSSAPNTCSYIWTIPETPSSQCLVKISNALTGNPFDTSDTVFSITSMPTIYLNRNKLHFNANKNGIVTKPQEVKIDNLGGGTLNWSIIADAPWLIGSPTSGTGNGIITVSVNPDELAEGTYTGFITVSAPNAVNSPQIITVTLKVKLDDAGMAPFGEFSTPVDGTTVSGSIPVTGWALDETGIQDVKIYREETDGKSLAFIGDAVFVEGARPDVEALYPDYPNNFKAGWGYMLLTNFFPNKGNGVFKLHAVATDIDGHSTTLGVKTIIADNDNAAKPYGAIDKPVQGGIASGKSFINWGWVLTPQPNNIPPDGSTIAIWIDGVKIGHPVYNNYREDIASLFPGNANSNGAVGYYYLDTTKYKNGIHTIHWTALDNAGNSEGIGSRYFAVLNPGADDSPKVLTDKYAALNEETNGQLPSLAPILVKKGYDDTINPDEFYPDECGVIHIEIAELERLELKFDNFMNGHLMGYLIACDKRHELPIGSMLDRDAGIFYWQPGVGFLGKYHLVFAGQEENGRLSRKDIVVTIWPK